MDIGFIGLGNMGAHMARRLVEAGHRVVVYDTRQEAIGNLAALGAVAARSPAEVADARRSWRACRRRISCSTSRPVRAV
jgi:3-hydroxyisobutyrate dehydrogenase-like beta-hydroxyacid dehydrogenase